MQTLYVPKYNLHYRVNPRNPRELQWSRKPFGPATQWQHAMSFKNPIRALDLDDETKQGVVVLNDSTTYVGSGVRTWGRKFYPAGTRIYSLYAIGESLDIKVGTDEEFICLYYGNTLVLPDGTIVDVTPTTRRPHKFGIMDFSKDGVIHGYDVAEPSNEYDIYCDDVSVLQQWSDRNGWGVGIGRDAPSMAVAKEIETNKKLGIIPEKRKTMSKIRIKVHEKATDGVIHNIPLQKRAIKDMLIELNHDGDNKEYNPKDSIQVNKYVHDTAAVTPEWVLQHLGADKSAQIEDLKQNTNLTPIQIASKLDLLDDPVIWMYYDEPTGTDVVLIWKSFLE